MAVQLPPPTTIASPSEGCSRVDVWSGGRGGMYESPHCVLGMSRADISIATCGALWGSLEIMCPTRPGVLLYVLQSASPIWTSICVPRLGDSLVTEKKSCNLADAFGPGLGEYDDQGLLKTIV